MSGTILVHAIMLTRSWVPELFYFHAPQGCMEQLRCRTDLTQAARELAADRICHRMVALLLDGPRYDTRK